MRVRLPATVRTVLVIVSPRVAGSRKTLPAPPTPAAVTPTITMFSLSVSAENGAA